MAPRKPESAPMERLPKKALVEDAYVEEKLVEEAFAKVAVPVKVGLVANTAAPLPVSSVSAVARFAEEKEPREVALPTEVMAPVRFALVVTVAALPPMESVEVEVVRSAVPA